MITAGLYGAIPVGIHDFFIRELNKADGHTSRARFTHVLLLENGIWLLKEVLSYHHHYPSPIFLMRKDLPSPGSAFAFESVSHSRFCHQVLRPVRIIFDLFPDLGDEDPEVLRLIKIFRAPDVF